MTGWIRRIFSKPPIVPWAVIIRTYEDDGGGTVAVLDCGHEIYIDYRTPRFRCPLCKKRLEELKEGGR